MSDMGTEFMGRFSRGVEQIGSLHHVIDVEAPWQNGRCEKHGGLIKVALVKALRTSSVANLQELDDLMDALVGAKNRYYNRGGFSPCQLVFGANPRLPQSLLSDDPSDEVGLGDLCPRADEDSAAAGYRKAHEVRQLATKTLIELDSRVRLTKCLNARSRTTIPMVSGQWVYAWRNRLRAPGGKLVSRWVGPGVVLLTHGSSVFVLLGRRLWKCSRVKSDTLPAKKLTAPRSYFPMAGSRIC
jgi:hypothetical protein